MADFSTRAHCSLVHVQLLIQVIMTFVMTDIPILRLRRLRSKDIVAGILRLRLADSCVIKGRRYFCVVATINTVESS